MEIEKGEKVTKFIDGDNVYIIPTSAVVTVKDTSGMINIRLVGSRKNIVSYNEN